MSERKYIRITLEEWYSLCTILGNYTGLIEGMSILKNSANFENINDKNSQLQDWFLSIKQSVRYTDE